MQLPPHLQQKGKRARGALKVVESAAAAASLRASMSDGPPVVLPHVDLHEHLAPVSSLLSAQQNAAIHEANFRYGTLVDPFA